MRARNTRPAPRNNAEDKVCALRAGSFGQTPEVNPLIILALARRVQHALHSQRVTDNPH